MLHGALFTEIQRHCSLRLCSLVPPTLHNREIKTQRFCCKVTGQDAFKVFMVSVLRFVLCLRLNEQCQLYGLLRQKITEMFTFSRQQCEFKVLGIGLVGKIKVHSMFENESSINLDL